MINGIIFSSRFARVSINEKFRNQNNLLESLKKNMVPDYFQYHQFLNYCSYNKYNFKRYPKIIVKIKRTSLSSTIKVNFMARY